MSANRVVFDKHWFDVAKKNLTDIAHLLAPSAESKHAKVLHLAQVAMDQFEAGVAQGELDAPAEHLSSALEQVCQHVDASHKFDHKQIKVSLLQQMRLHKSQIFSAIHHESLQAVQANYDKLRVRAEKNQLLFVRKELQLEKLTQQLAASQNRLAAIQNQPASAPQKLFFLKPSLSSSPVQHIDIAPQDETAMDVVKRLQKTLF